MLPVIKALPDHVINQIAAGEVIERPASVLKELLENSLDAGAQRLDIDIEQAGRHLIRVSDDGHGMRREDLMPAIRRHHTSKLTELDDLAHTVSLGFRGEALASIASIARVSLSSCPEDQDHGWRISVAGGDQPGDPEPAPRVAGTQVEIRDLFFNTPARRKFLRSERTEFQHIQDVVRRIAYSRPRLRVRLSHDGRRVLQIAPAGDAAAEERRLEQLSGKRFQRHALRIEAERDAMVLRGWAAAPTLESNHDQPQYLFVNGRAVRDRYLRHAVNRCYEELLYPGKAPLYVLFLELDPQLVDVNVHPGKMEVRFRHSREVHDFVYLALSEGLCEPDVYPASRAVPRPPGVAETRVETRGYRDDHGPAAAAATAPVLLGTLGPNYLVAEANGELLIGHLPALAEELCYRRLKGGTLHSRPLLIPAELELNPAGRACVRRQTGALRELGIDVIERGDRMLVNTLPVPVVPGRIGELVEALAAHLEQSPDGKARAEGALRMLARHHTGAAQDAAGVLRDAAEADLLDVPRLMTRLTGTELSARFKKP